jgi:SAM-dependent methyltransferase
VSKWRHTYKELALSFFETIVEEDKNVTVGTHNASIREKWIEQALESVPAGARILDAGAGECQFRRFCTHLNYVSQDLAQYDGSGNDAGLQTGTWDTSAIDIVCDICNVPEPNGSFDAILCTEVLEHLPDATRALEEFSRLLRPGGRLIITAPFSSLTHFAPYHFATGFNRYYYLHHLERLGFENIEIMENGNFFEFVGQELRRIEHCAQQYTGSSLTRLQRLALKILLAALEKFSARDMGSKELLNFGLHVTAIRGGSGA